MDENSYFLDMTICIYIHVGNSQKKMNMISVIMWNVDQNQETLYILFS